MARPSYEDKIILKCDVCQNDRCMGDLTVQTVLVDLAGLPTDLVSIRYCIDNPKCEEGCNNVAERVYREQIMEDDEFRPYDVKLH